MSKDSRVSEILESASRDVGAVGDPLWTIGGSEVLRHGEVPYSRVPTSYFAKTGNRRRGIKMPRDCYPHSVPPNFMVTRATVVSVHSVQEPGMLSPGHPGP